MSKKNKKKNAPEEKKEAPKKKLTKVMTNHPLVNSLNIPDFPGRVDCGDVLLVNDNVLKTYGKHFTILEGKNTKDIAGSDDKKKVKSM